MAHPDVVRASNNHVFLSDFTGTSLRHVNVRLGWHHILLLDRLGLLDNLRLRRGREINWGAEDASEISEDTDQFRAE